MSTNEELVARLRGDILDAVPDDNGMQNVLELAADALEQTTRELEEARLELDATETKATGYRQNNTRMADTLAKVREYVDDLEGRNTLGICTALRKILDESSSRPAPTGASCTSTWPCPVHSPAAPAPIEDAEPVAYAILRDNGEVMGVTTGSLDFARNAWPTRPIVPLYAHPEAPDPSERENCPCFRCIEADIAHKPFPYNTIQHMVICPTCGNKRCPHAEHHDNPCTGSNEPGQPGAVRYPEVSSATRTARSSITKR